jgi:hypothetical protein
MSSNNIFIRSLYPGGVAKSTRLEEVGSDAPQRQAPLQAARNVEEVLQMVPSDYSSALRPPLLEIASLTAKRAHAEDAVVKLKLSLAEKTTPSILRSKEPEVQVCKDFRETVDFRDLAAVHSADHAKYVSTSTKRILDTRQSEADFLNRKLKPESLLEWLTPIVDEVGAKLLDSSKTPRYVPNPNAPNETLVDGWDENFTVRLSYECMKHDVLAYAYRIISLTAAKTSAMTTVIPKLKRKLQTDADVVMADVAATDSKLKDLVDKAVTDAVRKIKVGCFFV